MKHRIIRLVLVLIVFITSVVITSNIINLDSEDMTSEMSEPTLPIISIEYNGTKINSMNGYLSDMDLSYMRESITPLMAGRKIHMIIDNYSTGIESAEYEVRTVDGLRLIENTKIEDLSSDGQSIEADIVLKDLIINNREYELIIILTLSDQRTVKYYTRVVNPEEYYVSDKLEYVSFFSKRTFNKMLAEDLIMYLEPNSTGDNTTFGNVNIHSNFNQVTWGDLNPTPVTEPKISIKELSGGTGSFLVDFYVSTTSEDNYTKYYKVREFYRVRYTKERMYLLDYERSMDEVFENVKDSYFENSIMLGIKNNDVNMSESEDGANIAFVANGRLFSLNTEDNRVAYLFGFFNEYSGDERKMNDTHDIKIMDVDEAGNVTFLVYGYFSRGDHEGTSGVSAYYYNAEVNSIEELLYIPSTHAPDLLMKEVDKLSYMNSKGVLYMLIGTKLYGINSQTRRADVIASDLTDGKYVISDNNRMVAFLEGEGTQNSQKMILMNLETGGSKEITVPVTETLSPIDFIGEDLIYGIADKADITKDRTGNILVPMYEVLIENEKQGVLMEYNRDGIFVTSGEVNKNQILLRRIKIDEEGDISETTDDQIMNSQDVVASKNAIVQITTELYEKLTKIDLKSTINPSAIRQLTPRMVLFEGSRKVDLDRDWVVNPYVVYGKYGTDSLYVDANEAVKRAFDISGIVMNGDGEYIWMKTSRKIKNQIMAIKAEEETENRSSLAVCLDTMLDFRGVVRNSEYMLNQGASVLDILKSALPEDEILDLTGCSLEMVLYYINQDIPALVMLDDGSAVMLIGYNETEVVIMNPQKDEIYKISREDAIEWFDENGNCFITYMPKTAE